MRNQDKLGLYIEERLVLGNYPIEAVVHNDLGVGIFIDYNTNVFGHKLPLVIDIEHRMDTDDGAVYWTKGHDMICKH